MTAQVKDVTYELFCPYCGFFDLVHTTTLDPSLPIYGCPECGGRMQIIEEEVSE